MRDLRWRLLLSILLAIAVSTANAQNDIVFDPLQEALLFSNRALLILDNFIADELPDEAQAEGNIILSAAQDGMSYCESLLKTVENIGQYKKCASEQLGSSLEALGWLKQRYEPYSSSAAGWKRFGIF